MRDPIRFRVRPGYHSTSLLVEVCGDHRAPEFPNIAELLRVGLGASQKKHPDLDEPTIAMSMDRFFSYWSYKSGAYEIDDDIWGLFVTAPENNDQIISEIEQCLLATGMFEKEEVDFAKYA